MTIEVVPTSACTRVRVRTKVQHYCPWADETDTDAITIEWTCAGETIELHSLASHLYGYRIATASAVAFAFSELVDFLLFTWISPRWSRAVLAGGLMGAVVDSVLFVTLAFGSLQYVPGQILGKSYGIVIAALLIPLRRAVFR
jgi:uncharacterized PurR-regulated membrane protein YhhQ (DUF165 family)